MHTINQSQLNSHPQNDVPVLFYVLSVDLLIAQFCIGITMPRKLEALQLGCCAVPVIVLRSVI